MPDDLLATIKRIRDRLEATPLKDKGGQIEMSLDEGVLRWRFVGDEDWQVLAALADMQITQAMRTGPKGDPGSEIQLRTTATDIQWKRSDEEKWYPLIAIKDIKGEPGADVELRTHNGNIEWKDTSEEAWRILVPVVDLKGPKGDEGPRGPKGETVEFRVTDTHFQWRYSDDIEWRDAFALDSLTKSTITNITGGGGGGSVTDAVFYDIFKRQLIAGENITIVEDDANKTLAIDTKFNFSDYVPYTGATGDVDLGANSLSADGLTVKGSTSGIDFTNEADTVEWSIDNSLINQLQFNFLGSATSVSIASSGLVLGALKNLFMGGGSEISLSDASTITQDELSQLQTLGTTEISADNWTYLAAMDQAVSTTSNVEFNEVFIDAAASAKLRLKAGSTEKWNIEADLNNINFNHYTVGTPVSITQTGLTIDTSRSIFMSTGASISLESGAQISYAELGQLANIGATTISATQWGYLGGLDQALTEESNVTFGDLTLTGNLTVGGTTTTVNSTTVTVADNLIVLNSGEVGAGVTAGTAGIEIDRGSATNYQFMFRESDDSFVVGEIGSLQAVATREDSPIDGAVAIWNASESRFVTYDNIFFDIIDFNISGSGSQGINLISSAGGAVFQLKSNGGQAWLLSAPFGSTDFSLKAGSTEHLNITSSGAATFSSTINSGAIDVSGTLTASGRIYGEQGGTSYGFTPIVSAELGTSAGSTAGALKLWGATAGRYSTVQSTTDNLHLDTYSGLYLNYYNGSGVYFGNGANGVVATIDSSGNIETEGNLVVEGTGAIHQVTSLGGAFGVGEYLRVARSGGSIYLEAENATNSAASCPMLLTGHFGGQGPSLQLNFVDVSATGNLTVDDLLTVTQGSSSASYNPTVSLELGTSAAGNGGAIKFWGYHANKYSLIHHSSSNLHIDTNNALYLNYYNGLGVYFGNGANSTVGNVDSSGNLTMDGVMTASGFSGVPFTSPTWIGINVTSSWQIMHLPSETSANEMSRYIVPSRMTLTHVQISVDDDTRTNDYFVRVVKNEVVQLQVFFDDSAGDFNDSAAYGDKVSRKAMGSAVTFEEGDRLAFQVRDPSSQSLEVSVIGTGIWDSN